MPLDINTNINKNDDLPPIRTYEDYDNRLKQNENQTDTIM